MNIITTNHDDFGIERKLDCSREMANGSGSEAKLSSFSVLMLMQRVVTEAGVE